LSRFEFYIIDKLVSDPTTPPITHYTPWIYRDFYSCTLFASPYPGNYRMGLGT
jgi:hypothetical protein